MKKVLNKCQCQERAVKRSDSLLRIIICNKCGKVFRGNKKSDICFDCE